MVDAKIELGKEGAGPARPDVMEAVTGKLVTGIENHQIGGIKAAPDIIYPNGNDSLRMLQIVEGLAAPANDYGFTVMSVLKGCQGIHKVKRLSKTFCF
jgi:hypothetical protein